MNLIDAFEILKMLKFKIDLIIKMIFFILNFVLLSSTRSLSYNRYRRRFALTVTTV